MRNFSLPPYSITEIGDTVKHLGDTLGVHCDLCSMPGLKSQGFYSEIALANDIARIGRSHGITLNPTANLSQIGIALHTLITALASKGISVS